MRFKFIAISLAGGIVIVTPPAMAASEAATKSLPNPPALPLTHSKPPIEFLRELLAMKPEERAKALEGKSEVQRKVIFARLKELDSLDPNLRELELQRLKLRWQLVPLLRCSPDERTNLFSQIALEDQQALRERLQHWDQLPLELRKSVLENEGMLNCMIPGQPMSSNQFRLNLDTLSPAMRQKIEKDLRHWQQLPAEQQQAMFEQFQRLFTLSVAECTKTLHVLSETERQEMEKTLGAFRGLPQPQRQKCILSFEKFTSMSQPEMVQFLRNAQQWKEMSPRDRQIWRDLVNKIPMPPMPPGLSSPPSPPALPTSANPSRGAKYVENPIGSARTN